MKRKLIQGITIILLTSCLTGCWSKKELNELALVGAIAVDKTAHGFQVTVQVLNPSEISTQAPSTRVQANTYSAQGATLLEAIQRISKTISRQLYFAHLRIVILGDGLAKSGIIKSLDFFSRDSSMRTDFYILVAKNTKGADILNILTPLEKGPADKIYGTLDYSHSTWAPTRTVSIDELIDEIVSTGMEPVLTGIKVKGDPEVGNTLENVREVKTPADLEVTNLAVFKKDRLIGWLNERQSVGYNIITDNIKQTVDHVNCSGGKITYRVMRTSTKVGEVLKNNQPMISIRVKAEGNIDDVECKIDLTQPENITKIEKKVDSKVKRIVMSSVKQAQKHLHSDIYGFGEVIHRNDPKRWKQLEKNWDQTFADIPVEVNVDFKIRRLGSITKSFQ